MKIKEVTSPQDQLALLKTIMDNTWSAISQQANVPAKQTALPTKTTKPRAMKKIPHAAAPKPLPKSKPIPPTAQQLKNQQLKNQQAYAQQVQKTLAKNKPAVNSGAPKPLSGNIVSPIHHDRGEKEMKELIKIVRGEAPWKPIY